MRRISVLLALVMVAVSGLALTDGWRKVADWIGLVKPGPTPDGKTITLPVGWKVSPVSTHVQLPGDMVMMLMLVRSASAWRACLRDEGTRVFAG